MIELLDYTVSVRNEHTGETTTVSISAFSAQDAQIEALVQLFRSRGWRKAMAFLPVTELTREEAQISRKDTEWDSASLSSLSVWTGTSDAQPT